MLLLALILLAGGLISAFLAIKVVQRRDNKIATLVGGGFLTIIIAFCTLLIVSNYTATRTRWVNVKSQHLARAPVLSATLGIDEAGNLEVPAATALYSLRSRRDKSLIPLVGDKEHLISWDIGESLHRGEFAVKVQAEEVYRRFPPRSPWNFAGRSYWDRTGRIKYIFLYPIGDGPSGVAVKK